MTTSTEPVLTGGGAAPTSTGGRRRGRRRLALTARNVPYLFVLPTVILFAAFRIYPILYALWLSFTKQVGASSSFVGLANYQRLFHDPLFYNALTNTLVLTAVQVPLVLALAMLIALGLNSRLAKFRAALRLGIFLPIVTGLVAYSILFVVILDKNNGVLNYVLGLVGIGPVPWLNSAGWSKASIVLSSLWHYTGYFAVIFLAAMQSISGELYEAAAIDGAGTIRRFFSITVPQLRPIILFTVVLSTLGTLQLFDEPYTLTGGGPFNATTTLALYLYQNGFTYFDFNYASAIAYVVVILSAIVGLAQIALFRDREVT